MNRIQCCTDDLDRAYRCMLRLQNAAVTSEFVVISKTEDAAMLWDCNLISSWVMRTLADGKFFFGGNQISSYTVSAGSCPAAGKVGAELHIKFMADPKAINDLRCTCAVIARDLLNRLGTFATFTARLLAVQSFFTRQFIYCNSGQGEAHSAVDLLRSGGGVCQAIASMATIILPFMGIPCLYISGEGFSGSDWGPHGWNAVKSPEGTWIFVDFTFGLNSAFGLPSTINKLAGRQFLKNHRRDGGMPSGEALEDAFSRFREINTAEFTIRPNKHIFSMDGIDVSADRKVLRTSDGGYTIDLVFLFRMVGGAAEYIPTRDCLHVVLHDRQAYVEDISRFMKKDGTFDVRILNMLSLSYSFSDRGIRIRLGEKTE